MRGKRWIHLLVVIGLLLTTFTPVTASSPYGRAPGPGAGNFIQMGGRVSYHAQTGYLRFAGFSPTAPFPSTYAQPDEVSRVDAAYNFLSAYGFLFGVVEPRRELTVWRQYGLEDGREVVHYQQAYQGVPVVGGELNVVMDSSFNIISVNGEILPGLSLSTDPGVDAEAARALALQEVAKLYAVDETALESSEPGLWIYNPILLRPGEGPSRLVWRMDVRSSVNAPIKEFVLIDAQRGSVALHWNQLDSAKNRQTYTANNGTSLPGSLVCNESNPSCSGGDAHAAAAHLYAGDTYDFYWTNHSRDSIDNSGMALVSTVHFNSNYDNAFWDGEQMVYGDAYGYPLADDVVAHELTHGVTQYESSLFYYYQSGAINESLSDVWGEFVDLSNGHGNDTSGVRWQLGEDINGLGALRNMQDPTIFGDPDRMTSPNYYLLEGDNGGVHINSGINNKAVSLLTDGGTFNGQSVSALGIAKVAKIYYEVQRNLLVSGSDYADLHDLLYQGCLNIVGTGGITLADCQEVQDASNAVEMDQQPDPGYNEEASLCPGGFTPGSTLFFDDLESGSGSWAFGAASGTNRWSYGSIYGPYAHSGTGFLYANDYPEAVAGSYAGMNTSIALPPQAYIHFAHAFGFEDPSYDGGVLEYSTNGGASWVDAGSLIEINGYGGTIEADFGNPLGGRSGFIGDSHGYVTARANLSSLAGQSVRFRWLMGLDSSGYDWGWWVDDVRIYSCADESVPPGYFDKTAPANGATGVSTTPTLRWDSSNNATSYEYCIDTNHNNACDARATWISAETNTSIVANNLDPETSYSWQVRANNAFSSTYANTGTWLTFTTGTEHLIFFPIVMRRWPPIPDVPVINTIDNADGNGSYTVSWNNAFLAVSYRLEEDDNAAFTSPTVRYTGIGTSWSASGKPVGKYYYRVRASNTYGDSGWSGTKSVSVTPPTYFTAVGDADVIQGLPSNTGGYGTMWVGYHKGPCTGSSTNLGVSRSLVRFDLSAIPAGTPITNATLSLRLAEYCYSTVLQGSTTTVTAYRANSNWSEMAVTWGTQPGEAEARGSVGIALDSSILGSYNMNVTSLVQGWINGSFPNYGLKLRGSESSGNIVWFSFATSEWPAYAPFLTITYAGQTITIPMMSEVGESAAACEISMDGLVKCNAGEPTKR